MAEVGCGSWLDPVFRSLVVVGFGVWVVVRLWLKWVVGRRRSPVFRSSEVMVRLAWVTVMGLVEIGVGHRMVGWFFWVFDGFFFFFFLIIWALFQWDFGEQWAVVAWAFLG